VAIAHAAAAALAAAAAPTPPAAALSTPLLLLKQYVPLLMLVFVSLKTISNMCSFKPLHE
jgi:hypothetical protein